MQLRGTQIVVDTINARTPVISISGTARVLNILESGSTVLLDQASGNTLTLPDAPTPGTWYDVQVITTPTSQSHKILANMTSGTARLIGGVESVNNNDNVVKGFQSLEATANISLLMGGTTTGGQVGTRIKAVALSAGTWFISGLVVGTGTQVTPFATTLS